MDKSSVIAVVGGILIAISLFAWVFAMFSIWPSQMYTYDQGIEYLWAARKCVNLNDMADYIDKAVAKLADVHGNPRWFYPKVDTDIDILRADVVKISISAKVLSEMGFGSFAYQQGVQNLQEALIENIDHLRLARDWFTQWNAMSLVWLAVFILGIILAFLVTIIII